MSLWRSYKLRLRRRRWNIRALRKGRELNCVKDNTKNIKQDDIILVCTFRNEAMRLPYFLEYYRGLGVSHFLFIDNGSTDQPELLFENAPDISLWHTKHSYKSSRFGVDWINYLLRKYGTDHWCLVVDPNEFFVYPFCDSRPLSALTDWLDSQETRSFGTILLDLYPKGKFHETPYSPGQDPTEIACWFDYGNYTCEKNHALGNLWIQGGARARQFFSDTPKQSPALNKIPLVKWKKRYAYESSTHMILPRGLNLVYDESGGERASGVLLHTKFIDTFGQKATEELKRNQHYAQSKEYQAYAEGLKETPDFWHNWSERYINWRQLEILGLMSKGNWG